MTAGLLNKALYNCTLVFQYLFNHRYLLFVVINESSSAIGTVMDLSYKNVCIQSKSECIYRPIYKLMKNTVDVVHFKCKFCNNFSLHKIEFQSNDEFLSRWILVEMNNLFKFIFTLVSKYMPENNSLYLKIQYTY